MAKRQAGLTRPQIPEGLTPEYRFVYDTILDVVEGRSEQDKVRLVVITDLAKDFDDLLALIILKEFHRMGAIELLGVVANLNPAKRRALLGRGALDRLGLTGVPIAIGTKGEHANHEVLDYEFSGSEKFIAKDDPLKELPQGQDLLFDIFTQAKEGNYKVTFLGLSSLMDIAQFTEKKPELVKAALGRVVLQGGYSVVNGKLEADITATNNHFAFKEAQYFHQFVQANNIPSQCFTKVATFATPIYQTLLKQMESTGVDIGKYLRAVQLGQDLHFWKCASGPIEGRFRPFMDESWFLKNKTTWYERHPGEPGPPDITPWLDKVTAYDCLAAFGAAGEDILAALGVLKPLVTRTDAIHDLHQIVGVLPVADPEVKGKNRLPEEANIHGEVFATAIQALALGSLKAVVQGL